MKRWIILLLGLLLTQGVYACSSNELSVPTITRVVHPETSLTPSKILLIPTPTNTNTPPETQITTKTPRPSISLTPESPTTIICQETTGSIEHHQLKSDLFDDPLEYSVYLPPCYTEQQGYNYPVLYLFHGQTYTNQHWIDLGATDIADGLISSGELAPFIMVFPYDRDHYKPPTTNLFGQAVVFELIPAMDQEFRTNPTRSSRAIGGISRGGNWAAHISLQHPGLFSAIGLHSTPIFSTDTNREIVEWLEAIPIEEFPRLFLDIGHNDRWLEYTLVFEDLLNTASLPHEWYLYPGFHEDDYWKSHLEQYIRWYAQDW